MIRKEKACCFTGHRVIASAYCSSFPGMLDKLIQKLIQEGICDFITGGARGFDTLAAEAVLRLKNDFPHIRLILALPCEEQTQGWPLDEKIRYEEILLLADDVVYLSKTYTKTCMMRRNRFMVDNSSCCVFYLTQMRSGTYKTVEYAMEQGIKLYNLLSENEKDS